MDYAQILPRLFLGSHPGAIDDIDRLQLKAGVTAVLNLQTDEDMRAIKLTWEPLEAHYTACGVELLWVPVRDFDPIDLREKLPQCVRALDQLLAAGHSVYLHGWRRSVAHRVYRLLSLVQLALWHPAN